MILKVTGLWKSENAESGKKYLSGKISPTTRILVLPNQFRRNDRDPEFYLCVSEVEKAQSLKSDDFFENNENVEGQESKKGTPGNELPSSESPQSDESQKNKSEDDFDDNDGIEVL